MRESESLQERLSSIVSSIGEPDAEAKDKARARWLNIAKPLKSFGEFEEMVIKLAGIRGEASFSLGKKALIVMCADNGIVDEKVTQTDPHMTRVVTENFLKGDTSACKMASYAGADVFPVDIGVKEDIPGLTDKKIKIRNGTGNIAREDAMTAEEAERAVLTGVEMVRELKEKGYDIIATGEMGIGNTAVSSAVASLLLKVGPEEITGKGAGLSGDGLKRKIKAVETAVKRSGTGTSDTIEILRKTGGLDIAGLTGVFLGGAVYKIPVVIDGFISAVGALLSFNMNQLSAEYMLPSHSSKEKGEALILGKLRLSPVINAGMFTGEGTGALMLFPLLDMVLRVYNDMVTFDNWNGHQRYELLS